MIVSMMFLFFEVSLHACKAVLTKPKKTSKGENPALNVDWSFSVVKVHPKILTRSFRADEKWATSPIFCCSPAILQVASDGVRPDVRHSPASGLHPLCDHLLGHWPFLLLYLAKDAGALHWVNTTFECFMFINTFWNETHIVGHDRTESVWTLLLYSVVMLLMSFLDIGWNFSWVKVMVR